MSGMSPLLFILLTFLTAVVAGIFGSLLGLGGGVILIPVLTLVFHVDFPTAAGAGIVAVIATSSASAVSFVKHRLTNLRVSMWLEIGTTAGGLSGAYVGGILARHHHERWLFVIFGAILAYSAARMFAQHRTLAKPVPPDAWADALALHDEYFDQAENRQVSYRIAHSWVGLMFMYFAGMVSGLLGIGSGALKVPAMDLAMRMPFKVSTATSNFMMGVTAAASAGVYFARGQINPLIAGPVVLGVLIGATIGSRVLGRVESRAIRGVFMMVLLLIAARMLWQGFMGVHRG